MCGVVGVYIEEPTIEDLKKVREVLLETRVRGKHASGVSYLSDNGIETEISIGSMKDFLEGREIKSFMFQGGLFLIAHCRYSTSDLRYNQPITDKGVSICHNGVITQEATESWPYPTIGKNDSELVLRSLLAGNHPLSEFPDSSQAVCRLEKTIQGPLLTGHRNGKRPLWISTLERGFIFTSTADIAKRAGLSNTEILTPGVEYRVFERKLIKEEIIKVQKDLQIC